MPEPGIEPGTPKWKTKEIIWDYIFLPTAAFNTSNCDYVYVNFLLGFYWDVFDFSQFPDCFMKKSLVKGIWNANEKARKMKKIFCFDICSCHYLRQNLSTSDLSFSQVTSVEKREPRKHFSASAYGLGFKNFFLGTLFSTSVTWEKLKSDVDKLCLRRGKNKYRNKILFLKLLIGNPILQDFKLSGL